MNVPGGFHDVGPPKRHGVGQYKVILFDEPRLLRSFMSDLLRSRVNILLTFFCIADFDPIDAVRRSREEVLDWAWGASPFHNAYLTEFLIHPPFTPLSEDGLEMAFEEGAGVLEVLFGVGFGGGDAVEGFVEDGDDARMGEAGRRAGMRLPDMDTNMSLTALARPGKGPGEPVTSSAYSLDFATALFFAGVFTAYCIGVPSIGLNLGSPS